MMHYDPRRAITEHYDREWDRRQRRRTFFPYDSDHSALHFLPYDQSLVTNAISPIGWGIDLDTHRDTASMIATLRREAETLMKQIDHHRYLRDPILSISIMGNCVRDVDRIRIGSFITPKEFTRRIQITENEGIGGGATLRYYEYLAYFYTRRCEMPNAKTPFFFFIGDKGFMESFPLAEISCKPEDSDTVIETAQLLREMKKRFRDNVFLIRMEPQNTREETIVHQWQKAIGGDRVILLESPDVTTSIILGLIAIFGGNRTLEEYVPELQATLPEFQCQKHLQQVRAILTGLGPTQKLASDIQWLT